MTRIKNETLPYKSSNDKQKAINTNQGKIANKHSKSGKEKGPESSYTVDNIDKMLEVFLLKSEFEREIYLLDHADHLKLKNRKDFENEYKGKDINLNLEGNSEISNFFGGEISGLKNTYNKIQNFNNKDEYYENMYGTLGSLEKLLKQCSSKRFHGVSDIKDLRQEDFLLDPSVKNSLPVTMGGHTYEDSNFLLKSVMAGKEQSLEDGVNNYKKGVEFLSIKKVLELEIKYNIALIQVEIAKAMFKSSIYFYKNGDYEKFNKGFKEIDSLLKKSKLHLNQSENKKENLGSSLFRGALLNKIDKINESAENIIKYFEKLKIKQGEINGEQVLGASNTILESFLSKRLGKSLTNKDKKLLERLLGKDIFILNTGGKLGIDVVKEQEEQLKLKINLIGNKINEKQLKGKQTETIIVNFNADNKKLQKKREELQGLIEKDIKNQELVLQQRLKGLTKTGKISSELGVDKKLSNTGEGSYNGLYDGKVDNYSDISSYEGDISFGFDDKITARKLDHFSIYPSVKANYYPSEIISEYDQKTSKGNTWQDREKKRYENTYIATTNTYIGKTNKQVTKLTLPQNYTVNTGTLRLSKDVDYNILKDDYGFVYLVLDNPNNEKIEFAIDIGEDDTKNDFYVSDNKHEQLTRKLFSGPYSDNTENNLFSVVRNNPENYKTGEDIAQKIQGFIQSNYVYALDSNLNNIFNGYENQVEAVENTTVYYNGKKAHPAICNISSRMAVSYLRELGVPAVVVTGNMKMTKNEYSGHAWIRYYDKSDKKWKELDPTPTRQWKEVKYNFSDPKSQEAYELYRKQQENNIKRGEFEAEKKQNNREIYELEIIQEKMKNEQTVYGNDQFLGYLLQGELQGAYDSWEIEFNNFLKEYDTTLSKEKKDQILKEKIEPFIIRTLENIRIASEKSANTKDNKDMYRIYFEHNLAKIEEILGRFPHIEVDDLILQYQEQYLEKEYEYEELTGVLGNLDKGKQLIVLNKKLYIRDREKSFRLTSVLDLSNYEEYIDFKITPNGKHWSFVAKDSNGKYLIIKDGKEQQGRYEKINQYEIASNGDIYVLEESKKGLKSGFGNYKGKFKLYKNNLFIIKSDFYSNGIIIDSKKTTVVAKIAGIVRYDDKIFINGNILYDNLGNPIGFYNPKVNFIGDNVLITDNDKGLYLNKKRILESNGKMKSKEIKVGILVKNIDNQGNTDVYLFKKDGTYKKIISSNKKIKLNNIFISNNDEIAYISHPYGKESEFYIKGVNVIKDKGYKEDYGSQYILNDDFSKFIVFARTTEGKQIININNEKILELEGNVYNFRISDDYSVMRFHHSYKDKNGNKKIDLVIIKNGQETRYENIILDYNFDKGLNIENFHFARKEPNGTYSYLINGEALKKSNGELFTTPLLFNIKKEKEGILVLRFTKMRREVGLSLEGKSMRETQTLKESIGNKSYIINPSTGVVEEIQSDDFEKSDNGEHFILSETSGNKESIRIISNGNIKRIPKNFDNIEDIQISNDGKHYGYIGINGNQVSIIRNNQVLWSFEINQNHKDEFYNLEFSDNFEHFMFSKHFGNNGEELYFNYLDGVYLDSNEVGLNEGKTGIFKENSKQVEVGKITIPQGSTVVQSGKGKLYFEKRTKKNREKPVNNIELMRIVGINEFAIKTFEIGNKEVKGEKINKQEYIFIMQNYCSIADSQVLNYDKDQFKELLIKDKLELEKRLLELESKENLSIKEKGEKRKIKFFNKQADKFLSSFDDFKITKNLKHFCDDIINNKFYLLFDNSIENTEAKVNGIIIVLSSAIKNNDQKMIDKIIQKLENVTWKDEVLEKIEKNHYGISLHARHRKWREIYNSLKGNTTNDW